MIVSCSAWNSDQEYILDCMFLSSRRVFLSIEISATKWQVLELNFIMIASCSAWNSDQEYVCCKWFWAVEGVFLSIDNSATDWQVLELNFSYDIIVFSVKFWSRICLFQMVLCIRSAFFYVLKSAPSSDKFWN